MLFLKLQSVLEGRLISSQFTADQEWWRFHNVQNPHLDTVRSSLFDHRLDGGLREFGIDRKSTRLNSSHGYISYAVFCLKKKNKQNNSTCTDTLYHRTRVY